MRGAAAIGIALLPLTSSVAWAQSAPSAPAAPPAPPPTSGAPPSGAPALAPVPNTRSAVPPTPAIGNTPSQSNVETFPPSRLANPPAGPLPGNPSAPTDDRRQPLSGGANSSQPTKPPKTTGGDYTLSECLKLWDAGTHMTRKQWSVACRRVERRLDNLEATAEQNNLKKSRTSRRDRDRNVR